MSPLVILLFGVGLASASVASLQSFHRDDYTYVEKFNAFYKFHCDNNGGNWSSTYEACEEEGTELFYPKERDEWTVVKELVKALLHVPIVSNIFVGTRDKINVTSPSTSSPPRSYEIYGDGRCVTLHTYTGALIANECSVEHGIPRSFVCKKAGDKPSDVARDVAAEVASTVARAVASEIAQNVSRELAKDVARNEAREVARNDARDVARVVARVVAWEVARNESRDITPELICTNGYQHMTGTGKCYKVFEERMIWSKAQAACFDEGGSLLVLESKAEAEFIKNKFVVKYIHHFIGIRRDNYFQEYSTITGHKAPIVQEILIDSEYGISNCVSIWVGINIHYASKACTAESPFICEK